MPEKVEIEEEEEDDLYYIFDVGDLIDDGDPSTKLEGEKIPVAGPLPLPVKNSFAPPPLQPLGGNSNNTLSIPMLFPSTSASLYQDKCRFYAVCLTRERTFQ